MDGLQKKLFKCSWSFLLFSVGVCHAKGESLLSLFSFFFFWYMEGYYRFMERRWIGLFEVLGLLLLLKG